MRYVTEVPRSAELVVLGGGVVGAATAFFASRAGIRVLLLERRPALCSLTTAVATGGYRLQLDHEDELPLVRRSVELFERFADETGQTVHDPGLRRQGYLWLTRDPQVADRQRELVDRQRGWGIDGLELLSGDQARERFPWLSPAVLQARFRAADGLIDPRPITMGLAAGSTADVALGCSVTGFGLHDGRLVSVETTAGRIAVERAVIACGPLSGLVAGWAGVQLPVEAVRRHRMVMWHLPDVPADAPMTIDEDTTAHWRPIVGGAYRCYPDPDEPATPPVEHVAPDHALAFRLLDPSSPIAVARTAPFWERVWRRNGVPWAVQAGQYTMTPDQRPLIGETEVPGLFVNTGYSGHGVMAGPGGSELLKKLLAGRAGDNPFRLDRSFHHSTQAF
ncbi:MAG: NAD(P)/FAD-dependent oxidoreductase [Gaiellales bacterium]